MNELTQAYLRELFDYNESAGEFVWRISRGKARAGTVAGRLNSNGYHQIAVDGRLYQRSRLVFLYVDGILLRPDQEVDHRNRIRHDDRRANLNPTDHTGNAHNRNVPANNTSGAVGVSWNNRARKWRTDIRVSGEHIFLGHFRSFESAVAVYQRHRRLYFGAEF